MLEEMGKAAKRASYHLAVLSSAQKNQALALIADYLEQDSESILQAKSRPSVSYRVAQAGSLR